MFLSAKNRPQDPIPMVSTQKFQSMNTPKKGGRPPLGRARKQEYRITLRCNTACNFKLRRLRSEHLEWLVQLKGLARNLNQLTRLANAKGLAAVRVRHAAIVTAIEKLLKQICDGR